MVNCLSRRHHWASAHGRRALTSGALSLCHCRRQGEREHTENREYDGSSSHHASSSPSKGGDCGAQYRCLGKAQPLTTLEFAQTNLTPPASTTPYFIYDARLSLASYRVKHIHISL